jgi:hypothetical protein
VARTTVLEAKDNLAKHKVIPPATVWAVGQCLWRRIADPSFSKRCAMVLKANEVGEEAVMEAAKALSLGVPPKFE